MPRATGSEKLSAAAPPSVRTSRISSVAYATDDKGSEANTASATVLFRRSCRACASGIGAPSSRRLTRTRRIPLHRLYALPTLARSLIHDGYVLLTVDRRVLTWA